MQVGRLVRLALCSLWRRAAAGIPKREQLAGEARPLVEEVGRFDGYWPRRIDGHGQAAAPVSASLCMASPCIAAARAASAATCSRVQVPASSASTA
jgi:hypothetical protein